MIVYFQGLFLANIALSQRCAIQQLFNLIHGCAAHMNPHPQQGRKSREPRTQCRPGRVGHTAQSHRSLGFERHVLVTSPGVVQGRLVGHCVGMACLGKEGGHFNRFSLLFIRLKACLGGMFSGRREKCAQKQ